MKNDTGIQVVPLNTYDFDFVYELYNDLEVTKYAFHEYRFPQNDIIIKGKLNNWLSDNSSRHFLIKYNGELVGIAQIYFINHLSRKGTIGLMLKSDFQMRGIGTEVLYFLLDVCFNQLNLNRVEGLIEENNVNCIKLFEKFDFVKEGLLRSYYFKDSEYKNVYVYAKVIS